MGRLLESGEIVDGTHRQPPPFLRLAFRPFFLLGSLFSIISLAVWAGVFSLHLPLALYGGALWWHVHEMLFGFAAAIIVGFLLTAVRTWTGQPGLQGTPLACLVLLWVCGRLVLLLPWALPSWLAALLDIAFLPAAAVLLAGPIVRVRQWRNSLFLPLLLAMTAVNVTMHLAAQTDNMALQSRAGTVMVMLIALLMTIMAGRVVPMFTANGTGTARVAPINWLEKLTLSATVATVVMGCGWLLPPALVALVFWIAACAHAVRALRWRPLITLGTPLLWSLHLSYLCIPVGLLLYGLSLTSNLVSSSQAIHTLTVGAMGLMILGMISRVSLGHTGRPLRSGAMMAAAFVLVFCAFLVRVFGSYLIDSYAAVILAAATLWALGYGCFTVRYLVVLTTPRADALPG